MNKIKIIFLMPSLSGGGTERVISLLCNNLDPERFDVSLALVKKKGHYLNYIDNNVNIIDIGRSRVRYAIFDIIKMVNNNKPDILFSSLGEFNLIMAFIKPFISNTTSIVTRESNTVSVANKDKSHPYIYDFLYKNFYSKLDNIICQCNYMKNDLENNYNFNAKKLHVINNPVDFCYIDNLIRNKEKSLNNHGVHELNIVAAGRLENQKGFDLLIKSLSSVRRPFNLTILGEGSKRNELQSIINNLGLEDNVKLVGLVTDPFSYFMSSDVFILSSRYEGFPNVVLEACAVGLPVIGFDSPGGTADIINNDNLGVLVPYSDNDNDNVTSLSCTIEDFDLNVYDSDIIKESIKSRYNIDVIVEKYSNYLESILDDKKVF